MAGLFAEPPDKEIIAFDFHGNPQTRNLKNFKWRISVYALIKDGDKILVQHNPKIDAYGLPGGGVEIGEKLEEALIRECHEEIGYDVEPVKLLAIAQDTFTFNEEDAFSLLLLFSARISGGNALVVSNDEDSDRIEWKTKQQLLEGGILRVFHKFEEQF
jgi:8-oxo-dGTP pyrophosphatase MutT (NUDIX family)